MVSHSVAPGVLLGPEFAQLIDDTEEALLGSMLHQRVIVSGVNSLTRHGKRSGLGWKIGNQLKLVIPRARGGRSYQPSPDIIVHTAANLTERQPSLPISVYGPPALAIEICSPSTAFEHDIDTINPLAKPGAYARAGIPEYLVFDPTGDILPELIRAWRAGESGDYEPWLPDPATGRWHSALGISFVPRGTLLRVYDPDGNVVPDNDDMDNLLTEREAQLAARDARIAELEEVLRRREE